MLSLVCKILAFGNFVVLMSYSAFADDLGINVGQTANVLRSSTTSPIAVHSFVARSSCALCEKSLDNNVQALQRVYPGLEYRKYIAGASDDELEYYKRECPFATILSDELSLYRRAVSSYSGSFWLVVDNDRRILFSEKTSNTLTLEEVLSALPASLAVQDTAHGRLASIPLGQYSPLVDTRRVYQTEDTNTLAVVLDVANCVILHDVESRRTRYIRLDSALSRSLIGLLHSTQVGTSDTLMILANDYRNYRLCVRFNMRTGEVDTIPVVDLLTDTDAAVYWATSAAYSPRAQVVVTSPFRMSNHRTLKPTESLNVGLPLHSNSAAKYDVIQYRNELPSEYTTFSWTGLTNPAYRLQDVATDVICSWPANCERVYCWSPSADGSTTTVHKIENLPPYYRVYKKEFPYGSDRSERNKEYALRSFPVDVFVRDSVLGVIFSNYTFSDTAAGGREYSVQLGYHVQTSAGDGAVRVIVQELLSEGVSATFATDTKSILISRKTGRSLEVTRRRF